MAEQTGIAALLVAADWWLAYHRENSANDTVVFFRNPGAPPRRLQQQGGSVCFLDRPGPTARIQLAGDFEHLEENAETAQLWHRFGDRLGAASPEEWSQRMTAHDIGAHAEIIVVRNVIVPAPPVLVHDSGFEVPKNLQNLVYVTGAQSEELLEACIERADLGPDAGDDDYAPAEGDDRRSTTRAIRARRGQRRFRRSLRAKYGPKCMISGCDVWEIIEAAHIWPYRNESHNDVRNGLLLRPDLHTLFDLRLLGIEPATLTVRLAPVLNDQYIEFAGRTLICPVDARPAEAALASAWEKFREKWNL